MHAFSSRHLAAFWNAMHQTQSTAACAVKVVMLFWNKVLCMLSPISLVFLTGVTAVAWLKLYFLQKMQCCWVCLIGRCQTVLTIVILDTKIAVLARQWFTPTASLLQLWHRASYQNAKWVQVMNTLLCTSGKCHFTSTKYTHIKIGLSP